MSEYSLKITNDVFEPVNMYIELRQPINKISNFPGPVSHFVFQKCFLCVYCLIPGQIETCILISRQNFVLTCDECKDNCSYFKHIKDVPNIF